MWKHVFKALHVLLIILTYSQYLRASSDVKGFELHDHPQRSFAIRSDGQEANLGHDDATFNSHHYLYFHRVIIEFGQNIGSHVSQRILSHLQHVTHLQSIDVVKQLTNLPVSHFTFFNHTSSNEEQGNVLLISLGNASLSLSDAFIPEKELRELPHESFRVRFRRLSEYGDNIYAIAANGLPLDPHTHQNISFPKEHIHYGALVGSYALLEQLGFAFLHPLEPYYPPILRVSGKAAQDKNFEEFSITESPYWPERAFHLHTQHPLELTEVLQGHDIPQFGPHGSLCQQFGKRHYRPLDVDRRHTNNTTNVNMTYCERWEDMVIDVDYFYEWSIANRLNKVEWLLLHNFKWGDEFALRQSRLRKLTHLGHQYSLLIGADVPVGNKQQHGWYMVNVRLPIDQQKQQIRDRVDWIFQANFDFMTTESGLSEFTHPECDLMLDLINEFASYTNVTWGREAGIKVHCSTGQKCSDFLDPRTGNPINFNFLPTFAHPGLNVFPHTVQVYAFDDPTAGSYGNYNFEYVEDYLVYEAKQGKRAVLFYGETSYWVNVDIDVPLFLPIYGQRRQKDLRKIAMRERTEHFRMHGQLNFDSGWEWGYWLNDVVAARASWNPYVSEKDVDEYQKCTHKVDSDIDGDGIVDVDDNLIEDTIHLVDAIHPISHEAHISNDLLTNSDPTFSSKVKKLTNKKLCPPHSDEWDQFARGIDVFTSLYGPVFGPKVNNLILSLSKSQIELLVYGEIDGRVSPNLKKLSGIAYLMGTDTWVDLPRMFKIAFTQPDKVHLKESDDEDWPYVIELLVKMDSVFSSISFSMDALYDEIAQQHQTAIKKFGEQTKLPIYMKESDFYINDNALSLLQEIKDGIKMLSLRAHQVKLLYESRDNQLSEESKVRKQLQSQARSTILEATEIVRNRESQYRVHWERIAAWRENPTVYRYGYLWSVHSLYYWWRDQGVAEKFSKQSDRSPCYLNRMDSTEVAMGWGKYTLELLRTFVHRYTPFASFYPLEIVNCLSPSSREYEFPRDL